MRHKSRLSGQVEREKESCKHARTRQKLESEREKFPKKTKGRTKLFKDPWLRSEVRSNRCCFSLSVCFSLIRAIRKASGGNARLTKPGETQSRSVIFTSL